MKKFGPSVLLLTLLLGGCASAPTRPFEDLQHEISERILVRLNAVVERFYKGDPLAYVELLAEDVTYFAPITAGRLDSRAAVHALMAPFQGKIDVPRFEILNPKLQLHGDIGVFTYNLNEYATDGTVTMGWNCTEVYRRSGDNWQIVHAHWSQLLKAQ